jgi:hypothetical protein
MKYSDALKIYNQGKPAWCSPRKGTNDYKAVLAIMKGSSKSPKKASLSKASLSKASLSKASLAKASLSKASLAKSSLSKASLVMAKMSSKKPSSKSLMFKKANIIQRFLKNKLILTKNNLDTRIQRYNLIKKRLADIKSNRCLTKKKFGNKHGYTIDGIVNLEKKIGSDSVNASIYLTSMPYLLGSYPIASKLMKSTANNESETKMNAWITENLILKKQSKHFVIMYKATKCPSSGSPAKRLFIGERLVNYNELCNGDLSSLMKTDERNDEMLMINLAYQVLIAVATYQNRVGYSHMDCHHGNFLYQLNTEASSTGYYHYVYNGLNFYIKSCKYNMCIFDFGLSVPMSKADDRYVFSDYYRILHGFVSEKTMGWIEGDVIGKINASMFMIMSRVQRLMAALLNNGSADMFQAIIDFVFKDFKPENGIFTTDKPANILNKIPFIINKVEAYPKIDFKNA